MQHFSEYREVTNKIQELELKLEQINQKLYGIRSPNLSDTHIAPKDNRIYLITEKDNIVKEITELNKRKLELYRMHNDEIKQVKDENYRRILRCVYLLRLPYEKIAEMMNQSVGAIRNMRYKADEELKEVLRKIM